MNLKEFRSVMDSALREEGLVERQLLPKRPKVWTLEGTDIVRFFHPDGYRRPWGFVYRGGIGIEIPSLRDWLNTHKPGDQAGIFQLHFVGYHTANDDVLKDFVINNGDPVPADLWVGLIMDRLRLIPPSLGDLIATYLTNREALRWLVNDHESQAWDFLIKWMADPDPSLHVPCRLPNWKIV